LTEEKENIKINKKSGRSPISKIVRAVFIFFLSVILFIIIVFILLQTTFFKSFVLHTVLREVNKTFESKDSYIYAETLEGNIFYNLKLSNVYAVVKGDTMFKVNSVSLDHNIFTLLDKKIDAKNVFLENPQINMTKIIDRNDTLWNLDYLLKPEVPEPKDTTVSEFDWVIQAENLCVSNLNFRMLAFKPLSAPIRDIKMDDVDTFNTDYLDITNLNLEADAFFSNESKKLDLKKLKFNTNSAVDLESFEMKAELSGNTLLRDFHIKTARTEIMIPNLFVENFNILNGFDFEEFQKKNLSIRLEANRADFADLKFFVPFFDFVNSDYYLKLDLNGKYKDFTVNQLDLRAYNTFINLAGTVTGLDDPSKVTLDLNLKDSEIDPSEVKRKVPVANLPDLKSVGKIYADARFTGDINRFSTSFDISSGAGSAKGDASVDLSGKDIGYRANVNARNINLAKITNNPGMKIILNADFTAEGRGTDYRTMNAQINYSLANSVIFNQNISRSSGDIKLNRSFLDMNLVYSSNTASIGIKGYVDYRNMDNINYALTGLTKNLDLSSLSPESEKTNLNFTFELQGAGLSLANIQSGKGPDLDKITGKYIINLEESNVEKYLIPPSPLVAVITNDGKIKSLNLASRFVDIHCTGEFSYESIPEIFNNNIRSISEKITERMNVKTSDTLLRTEVSNSSVITQKSDLYADLDYKITIKNLVPLYIITGDSSYSVTGEIRGKLENKENKFYFTSNGRFENFRYKDSIFNISNSKFTLNLLNKNESNDYRDIVTAITFSSQSIGAGKNKFDSIYVYLITIDTLNRFGIKANMDSTAKINTKGDIMFFGNEYGFMFDSLLLGYKNYNLSNNQPLMIKFIPVIDTHTVNNIVFNNFSLNDGRQKLNIDGTYSLSDRSDVNILASRLNINELFKLSNGNNNNENIFTGNIRRFNLNFKGTMEDPEIATELNTDPLAISGVKIGRIDAIVDYKNNILKPDVGFYNPNNEGKLAIKGAVPFSNPLTSDSLSSFLNENIDLTVIATNYQMKLLQKFIPNISDIDAKLFSDLNIKGKLDKPQISGNIDIDKGLFKLDLTGVKYIFNLKLNAEGQKLVMNNLKLSTPGDETRFISSNGYIDLTNLSLNDIDFVFYGDTKIFDKSVKTNTLGIYGDLIAGSGNPPLRLKGNQDLITLTGEFLIKQGNVFIPGFQSDAYSLYSDNIKYKVVIDSSSFSSDSAGMNLKRVLDSLNITNILIEDPFDYHFKISKDSSEFIKKKSQGKFVYNITVKNEKNIFARFVIDEKTRQEFAGEVSINLFADNLKDNTMNVRGNVDIMQNSTYKFYKNFNASGKVTFTGDVTNPVLNISASYKGSAYNASSQTNKNVEIILNVSGSAQKPELKWQVQVDGSPVTGDQTDNAISFILFGKLKDDLNASQRASLFSNVGVNLGSAFLSTYLNQFVSTYLPFILSTDINYSETQSGNLAEGTDIRFTASVGDATIRFGGKILTDLSNTNFLIEYPLNKILKFKSVSSNLILKFERIVDPYSSNTTTNATDNRTGGALIYRIKF